jgi:hypothetical protein
MKTDVGRFTVVAPNRRSATLPQLPAALAHGRSVFQALPRCKRAGRLAAAGAGRAASGDHRGPRRRSGPDS